MVSKNIHVPDNIFLLRTPPYSPELNPCEQIWQYLKKLFKNQVFKTIEELKQWLYRQDEGMITDQKITHK